MFMSSMYCRLPVKATSCGAPHVPHVHLQRRVRVILSGPWPDGARSKTRLSHVLFTTQEVSLSVTPQRAHWSMASSMHSMLICQ